jgi:hypothetical protein
MEMYFIDVTTNPQTKEEVLQSLRTGYVYGARLQSSGFVQATDAFSVREGHDDDACCPLITTTIHCTDGAVPTLAFWYNNTWYSWLHTETAGEMRGTIIMEALGYHKWVMSRSINTISTNVPITGQYSVIYTDLDYNGSKDDVTNGMVALGTRTIDGQTIAGPCTVTDGAAYAGWRESFSTNPVTIFSDVMVYICDHENMNDLMFATVTEVLAVTAQASANAAAIGTAQGDVAGLIAANAALYALITKLGVFGTKFQDVVASYEDIKSAGQYIPRP